MNKTFRELESFEKELIDPEIRKDPNRIQQLLSDDFLEFGSSGKGIRKRDVLEGSKRPSAVIYQLSNFQFRMLGEAHVLVAYQSVTSPLKQAAYRSSIWVKESGRWQMLHHQSTVIPDNVW